MMRIVPGLKVRWNGTEHMVMDLYSAELTVLRNLEDGRMHMAPYVDIEATTEYIASPSHVGNLPKAAWRRAIEVNQALQPLIALGNRPIPKKLLDQAQDELSLGRSSIYRLLEQYKANPTVSGLARKRRADIGGSRLTDDVEAVIAESIERKYLVRENTTVQDVWDAVESDCRRRRLPVPSINTVRRRVAMLHPRLVMSRRIGEREARNKFEPSRGSFPGADKPLMVYQIDHTPIDIILVDEIDRQAINRAWLTIVIDVCTRMIAGFCISLDAPSTLTVGLALGNAILPKEKWLAARGIDANWPIYGIPAKIYTDNGKDFRSSHVARSCREYGIAQEFRPRGMPNFGGHVERMFRTLMKKTQTLKGTTFSNVVARGKYDSRGNAVMTLDEYEEWFTIFVTKVYHQRWHRGLFKQYRTKFSPLQFFNKLVAGDDETIGIGQPLRNVDESKLRIDFLPHWPRTVQRSGVEMDLIFYWSDVLRPLIGLVDKNGRGIKYVFARDPRDIRELYFYDPALKRYFPIPYANLARPPLSIWEWNHARQMVGSGASEEEGFEALREMDAVVQKAQTMTTKTRRIKTARRHHRANAEPALRETPQPAPKRSPLTGEFKPFKVVNVKK